MFHVRDEKMNQERKLNDWRHAQTQTSFTFDCFISRRVGKNGIYARTPRGID